MLHNYSCPVARVMVCIDAAAVVWRKPGEQRTKAAAVAATAQNREGLLYRTQNYYTLTWAFWDRHHRNAHKPDLLRTLWNTLIPLLTFVHARNHSRCFHCPNIRRLVPLPIIYMWKTTSDGSKVKSSHKQLLYQVHFPPSTYSRA